MLFFNNGCANDNCFHLQMQHIFTKIKKWVHKVKRGDIHMCTTSKDHNYESLVHNYNDKRL
ncbi:hypothetical protein AAW31_04660 [Nitrosomonas communis]|uniref:Uncharacterized protein n=1 Tax=Nitrosomonas communis TaxID=44574 RepID=A0A0F7KAA9_9PROT|nr:hypothetical protein AAW31_04660 [Nitrosomonas communis]